MKAKAVRFLILAAVCTVALWPPAVSLAYEACPSTQCSFWQNVCEGNTGTYTQTVIGICEVDVGSNALLWNAHCEYTWRGPWDVQCVDY